MGWKNPVGVCFGPCFAPAFPAEATATVRSSMPRRRRSARICGRCAVAEGGESMNHRVLTAVFVLAGVALLAPSPIRGAVGRRDDADGGRAAAHLRDLHLPHADAAGSGRAALEGRAALSPEEAAQFEASERIRLNRDLFDPETGGAERRLPAAGRGGRAVVQRVQVRAGDRADRGQADRASSSTRPTAASRTLPSTARRGGFAVSTCATGSRITTTDRSLSDPLHPRLQRGAADDGGVATTTTCRSCRSPATWSS